MLFKVTNIEWDCDGEDPKELGLPTTAAQVECDDIEDVIDALSDEFGFLIESVGSIWCFKDVNNDGNFEWVDVSNE